MAEMTKIILEDERDFLLYRIGSGGTYEIFDIAIGSERRKGLGRQLLERLFKEIGKDKRVFAITRIENEIAQSFYEACKFSVSGVLRRFYGAEVGADAVMYVRSSEGPV